VRPLQTGAYGELAHMVNWHMANWLIRRTDYGKSAYGELAYGETASYRNKKSLIFFQQNIEIIGTLL